uniref:Uncharacterized protein n=1 Tax=Arundo donax TaxID=35708 RepID=A0A0A8XU52_ARUDO
MVQYLQNLHCSRHSRIWICLITT